MQRLCFPFLLFSRPCPRSTGPLSNPPNDNRHASRGQGQPTCPPTHSHRNSYPRCLWGGPARGRPAADERRLSAQNTPTRESDTPVPLRCPIRQTEAHTPTDRHPPKLYSTRDGSVRALETVIRSTNAPIACAKRNAGARRGYMPGGTIAPAAAASALLFAIASATASVTAFAMV